MLDVAEAQEEDISTVEVEVEEVSTEETKVEIRNPLKQQK